MLASSTGKLISLTFTAFSLATILPGCSQTPMTPKQLMQAATSCLQNQDYSCAQDNLESYLRLRPDDSVAVARLGIAENQLGEDNQAVIQFQKAIALGEGTYDLFSYYADSLAKLGETDAAIEWSYKALTVVPSLVDVRGKLAKLLVQKKRYFEALALLASFDEYQEATGQQPYFEGQRIAIETAMQNSNPRESEERLHLRLFKSNGNFVAPVMLGESHVMTFIVDTGATLTTVSDKFLKESKAKYEFVQRVNMRTADGRRVSARLINVDSMMVGRFKLNNIPVTVCATCQLLLGQQALSRFDLVSSKVQGVEFLTLTPRKA